MERLTVQEMREKAYNLGYRMQDHLSAREHLRNLLDDRGLDLGPTPPKIHDIQKHYERELDGLIAQVAVNGTIDAPLQEALVDYYRQGRSDLQAGHPHKFDWCEHIPATYLTMSIAQMRKEAYTLGFAYGSFGRNYNSAARDDAAAWNDYNAVRDQINKNSKRLKQRATDRVLEDTFSKYWNAGFDEACNDRPNRYGVEPTEVTPLHKTLGESLHI